MNPDNYASLEASKRLVEAGIVLETEAGWYKIFRPGCHSFDMVLSMRSGNEKFYGDNYPAPSMAEVWRELPGRVEIYQKRWNLEISKGCATGTQETHGGYADGDSVPSAFCYCLSTNPTDALIDLLIWVRKEANHA